MCVKWKVQSRACCCLHRPTSRPMLWLKKLLTASAVSFHHLVMRDTYSNTSSCFFLMVQDDWTAGTSPQSGVAVVVHIQPSSCPLVSCVGLHHSKNDWSLSLSCRYIRSERSVILINFCLSIISSNALILIGQTQTRNKVRTNPKSTFQCLLIHFEYITRYLFPCPPVSIVPGLVHPDRRIPPFLLPVLVLLGSDGGLAVVHGGDGSPQEPHHTQALPVSRLGWAAPSGVRPVLPPVSSIRVMLTFLLIFLPGLPALVVAISVGFTKAKGYGTPS